MAEVMRVKIDLIDINEGYFPPLSEEDLEKLKESIRHIGMKVPVILRRKEDGRFSLIDGRNRIRALKELDATEVEAIIEDIPPDLEDLIQYDLELCRRHLDKNEIGRIWNLERDKTIRELRNYVRKKIIQCLKIEEDIQVITETLDKMTLKELYQFYDLLKTMSNFPKYLNRIAKEILHQFQSKETTLLNGETLKIIESQYQKEIENLKDLLRDRETRLVELEETLNKLKEEKRRLEKEQEEFIKKQKEILDIALKKKMEEYEREKAELIRQLDEARAKHGDPEEVKKLLTDLARQAEEEKKELILEYEKQIADWRGKTEELRREILKLKNLIEEEKNEKEKIKKDLDILVAEKRRLTLMLSDYEKIAKQLTMGRTVIKKTEALREDAKLLLDTLAHTNYNDFVEEDLQKVLTILGEVEEIVKEVKNYVDDLLKSARAAKTQALSA